MIDKFTSTSKINLYLDIIDKDPIDNYHYLEGIFYEIPWGDDFVIYSSDKDKVIFTNTDEIPNDNTVTKALSLFKQKFNIDECFKIEITKNVPWGAGLGGGSGDAGCLLRWLANRYDIHISDCMSIAKNVGSDVPFFLYGGTAIVEGKGEKITPLKNKLQCNLLICYPNIHISTAQAFKSISKADFGHHLDIKNENFLKNMVWNVDILKKLTYNIFNNKLELINSDLFVETQKICDLATPDIIMMTGSGASLLLFYDDVQEMYKAKAKLEQFYTIFIQSI